MEALVSNNLDFSCKVSSCKCSLIIVFNLQTLAGPTHAEGVHFKKFQSPNPARPAYAKSLYPPSNEGNSLRGETNLDHRHRSSYCDQFCGARVRNVRWSCIINRSVDVRGQIHISYRLLLPKTQMV